MRNTRWVAVAGAMAATLLATGCGGGTGTGGTASSAIPTTSVAATTPTVFDQRAVYDEIMEVAIAAKLPDTDLPGIGGPTSGPSPSPSTEEERLQERYLSCTASWSGLVPPPEGEGSAGGVRDEFEETVDAFVRKGWTAGRPDERKTGDEGDTLVGFTLEKRGWTLAANYKLYEINGAELLLYMATEDSCMEQFTEEELDRLFSENGEQP
ncbi:hypothetical protein ACPB9E_20715 [Streptomyces exfoliatus]|uniref:hypothetical protein n=1 Tax=Streptomyces exfoliatus TaxID=1905 RepID=UPI003C2D9B9D